MKKWKKRIKRFLALWLKDELLDISGLGRMEPMVIPVHPNLKELKVDFVIRDFNIGVGTSLTYSIFARCTTC